MHTYIYIHIYIYEEGYHYDQCSPNRSGSKPRLARRAPKIDTAAIAIISATPMLPLHDIAITNIVWYMAYTRGVGGGGILRNRRAIVLQ